MMKRFLSFLLCLVMSLFVSQAFASNTYRPTSDNLLLVDTSPGVTVEYVYINVLAFHNDIIVNQSPHYIAAIPDCIPQLCNSNIKQIQEGAWCRHVDKLKMLSLYNPRSNTVKTNKEALLSWHIGKLNALAVFNPKHKKLNCGQTMQHYVCMHQPPSFYISKSI